MVEDPNKVLAPILSAEGYVVATGAEDGGSTWLEVRFEYRFLVWNEMKWALDLLQKEAREALEEVISGTESVGALRNKRGQVQLVMTDIRKGSLIVDILVSVGTGLAAYYIGKAIDATVTRIRARAGERSFRRKKGLRRVVFTRKRLLPDETYEEESAVIEFD